MRAVNIPATLTPATNIRLVVVDMDGTLLDDDGNAPPDLPEVLAQLNERGIRFCPASGRQLATLVREFSETSEQMIFIAENGTYVVAEGEEIASTTLDIELARQAIAAIRAVPASEGLAAVLCTKSGAFVENNDPYVRSHVDRYYAKVDVVDDLLAIDEPVLKIALFAAGNSERDILPHMSFIAPQVQIVVSGPHWVDVMPPAASKGKALRQIQQTLNITPDQTMVFGDYLNDLEMLQESTWSFAMANSHPDVFNHARYVAPANTRYGVMQVLARLLA